MNHVLSRNFWSVPPLTSVCFCFSNLKMYFNYKLWQHIFFKISSNSERFHISNKVKITTGDSRSYSIQENEMSGTRWMEKCCYTERVWQHRLGQSWTLFLSSRANLYSYVHFMTGLPGNVTVSHAVSGLAREWFEMSASCLPLLFPSGILPVSWTLSYFHVTWPSSPSPCLLEGEILVEGSSTHY
jgi:hypothetical protein